MAFNQGEGLVFEIPAQINEQVTFQKMQEQLDAISKKLTITIDAKISDTANLSNITNSLNQVQRQVDQLNANKVEIFDSSKMSQVPDITMKAINDIKNEYRGLGDVISTTLNFNEETRSVESFTMSVKNAVGEIQRMKFVAEGARVELNDIGQMAVTGFKPNSNLITDNKESAQLRDQQKLLTSWLKEQDNYFKQTQSDAIQMNNVIDVETQKSSANIEKVNQVIYTLYNNLNKLNINGREGLQSKLAGLVDTGNGSAVTSIQQQIQDLQKLSALQSQAMAQNERYNAQQAKANEQVYTNAIDQKIQLIQTFNDLEINSSEETYAQLKQLYNENEQYFASNINKQITMVNKLADAEKAAYEEANPTNKKSGGFHPMNHTGFGFGPMNMGITMVQFQAEFTLLNNLRQGFINLQQNSAGLAQVFSDSIHNQTDLNNVMNQFASIAQKYGASVDQVTQSAKLWGRQYKDVATALTLTDSATKLSIVDNLTVSEANKAVESSMNAMGESVTNAGQAYTDSMKLVDSWSAVSHEASVSAADLTGGFERAAAAAHNAGLTIDQLNSIISAGVRNTGRSGNVIGNMWKSVLANITSEKPKVIAAFKALGIQMTDTQGHLRPVYSLILDLSKALKTSTPDTQKYFEAIAGGKYQFDTLEASLSNTTTLTNALRASQQSQGDATKLAAKQMNTLHANLQRLGNAIQKIAYDSTNSNGLGNTLKGFISTITDFLNGLSNLPSFVSGFAVWGASTLLVLNRIRAVMNYFNNKGSFFKKIADNMKGTTTSANSQTKAWVTNSEAIRSNVSQIDAYISSQAKMVGTTEAETKAINDQTIALERRDSVRNPSMVGGVVKSNNLSNNESIIMSEGNINAQINKEKKAFSGLKAVQQGLRGLATGVGFGLAPETLGASLAIPAAIAGITALIAIYGKFKQQQQEEQLKQSQIAQSYEQNSSSIQKLASQYSKLSSNSNVTTDQQKQLNDVMNQLSKQLPNVTSYVDKNGQAHLISAQSIQKEVDALNGLNAIQKQKALQNPTKGFSTQIGDIKSLKNDIQKINETQNNVITGNKLVNEELKTANESYYQHLQDINHQYKDQLQVTTTLDNKAVQQAADYAKIESKIQNNVNQILKIKKVNLDSNGQGILQGLFGNIDTNLLSKYTKDIPKIQTLITSITKSYNDLNGAINGSDASGNPTTTSPIEAFNTAIKQAEQEYPQYKSLIEDITKNVDAMGISLSNAEQKTQTLTSNIGAQATSMQDVNRMVDEYNNKQKITVADVKALIKNHQDLASAFTTVDGKIKININILEKYQKAIKGQVQDQISGINSIVAAQRAALEEQLKMYGIQLATIKTVADAQNAIAKSKSQSELIAHRMGRGSSASDFQMSSKDQTNLTSYAKWIQNIDNYVNNIVPRALNSEGSTASGVSLPYSTKKSSTSANAPLTNYLNANQDPFTEQLNQLSSLITKTKDEQQLYGTTSEKYRIELKKQISLLEEKNSVTEKDINWLDKQISSLERLKNATSSESEKAKIQKQIDTYQNAIYKQQDAIAQIKKSVDTANQAITESKLQVFWNKLNDSITQTSGKINALKEAMSLIGNGVGTDQQKVNIQSSLVDTYQKQLGIINSNISALEQEQSTLKQNSKAWAENQTQIKNWQQQGQSTTSSIQSLGQSIQSDLMSRMNALKNEELNAITNQQQNMITNLQNMQKQPNNFGLSNWNDQLQSIDQSLNKIDGNFNNIPLFNDSTGTVRANLSNYNQEIKDIAGQAENFSNNTSSGIQGLDSQIKGEINFANGLQSTIKNVSEQVSQMQIAQQAQESKLQQKITDTTTKYNDQTTALQNQLNLLNQQYTTTDNLNKLQKTQTQLQQAMQNKEYQYVNSKGDLILTYDRAKVSQLQQSQDQMVQQLNRNDVKQALQNQINELNDQKTKQLNIMNQELTNMKNVHQQELNSLQQYRSELQTILQGTNSDIQAKTSQLNSLFTKEKTDVTNAWNSIETAVSNGTMTVQQALQKFSGKTTDIMTNLNVNFASQVQEMIAKAQQLKQIQSILSGVYTGALGAAGIPVTGAMGSGNSTSSGGGGSLPYSPNAPSGNSSSASKAEQKYVAGNGAYIDKSGQQVLGSGVNNNNENKDINNAYVNGGSVYNDSSGNTVVKTGGRTTVFNKSGQQINAYHEGGVVGQGTNVTPSGISGIVNKLFNTRPDEQVIKALVGEVMVPPQNIMKNFIPNMQNLAQQILGSNNGQSINNSRNISIYNPVIKANNPEELFSGIEHLVQAQ